MKTNFNKRFFIILVAICLTGSVFAQQNTKVNTKTRKDAISVIHNRKSVRDFTGKMISGGILDTLVRAGMAAPTAMNKQPWAFILINDRKTLNLLADSLPYAKMLYKAGGAIVVCGDLNKTLPDEYESLWIQDCSAATENILLAIEALGLGGVWTGVYPENEKVLTVRNILHIPSDAIPLNVIAIGFPSGKETPKNKYKKENIHLNKW